MAANGLFLVELQLDGATQFVSTSPVVTFNEYANINTLGPSVTARLVGYWYNAGGGAVHDVTIFLARPGSADVDRRILLEERLAANSEAVNSLSTTCGPDGFVVPKEYGLGYTAQPVAPGAVNLTSEDTFQLFIETANKATTATFGAYYSIDGM